MVQPTTYPGSDVERVSDVISDVSVDVTVEGLMRSWYRVIVEGLVASWQRG